MRTFLAGLVVGLWLMPVAVIAAYAAWDALARWVRHRAVQRRIANLCAQVEADRVRAVDRMIYMQDSALALARLIAASNGVPKGLMEREQSGSGAAE